MNCDNCKAIDNTLPIGWYKCIEDGCEGDLAGGVKWELYKCKFCGSVNNLRYRDVGINSSSWFYKNDTSNYLK